MIAGRWQTSLRRHMPERFQAQAEMQSCERPFRAVPGAPRGQVPKWLGHSTSLTLNTYGDWIPDEDADAISHLPTPPSLGKVSETGAKVLRLFG